MRRESARGSEAAPLEPARLARSDRRDALLDAAAELVASGDVDAVSMEAVAERAGVSRPLVYKHFANRNDLLAAVYQRESAQLHAELAAAVQAADTLEDMFRALIRGSFRAHASRGTTFVALRSTGRDHAHRELQHKRDRSTVRYFAAQAVRDFGLDEHQARAAVSIMLGAIEPIVAQWRLRPTRENAVFLEDTYAAMAVGGLAALAHS